ncbi:MAG: hypothetical protein OXT67_13385 [Zetaproteobacteria bacterium]|nr:hypothetical protein [Zetaproteobacteria bacterium]
MMSHKIPSFHVIMVLLTLFLTGVTAHATVAPQPNLECTEPVSEHAYSSKQGHHFISTQQCILHATNLGPQNYPTILQHIRNFFNNCKPQDQLTLMTPTSTCEHYLKSFGDITIHSDVRLKSTANSAKIDFTSTHFKATGLAQFNKSELKSISLHNSPVPETAKLKFVRESVVKKPTLAPFYLFEVQTTSGLRDDMEATLTHLGEMLQKVL